MKRLVILAVLLLALVVTTTAQAYKPSAWGCFDRQTDGQCIVTVSIDRDFAEIDQLVIREVLANFSESPNIETLVVQSSGSADVSMISGCVRRQGGERLCGFFTDLSDRTVYIDPAWSYANYCCDASDGMRGVYCHELMHAIAGARDSDIRLQPSCFNGTSPYLGVEDFAKIATAYPLP